MVKKKKKFLSSFSLMTSKEFRGSINFKGSEVGKNLTIETLTIVGIYNIQPRAKHVIISQ